MAEVFIRFERVLARMIIEETYKRVRSFRDGLEVLTKIVSRPMRVNGS